ncbi:MAG TPA: hypothetical protein VF980_01335 [Thermoanaerobaculia bacterium]
MISKRLSTVLSACLAFGGVAFAQTTSTSAEYSHASGGDIEAIAKQTDKLSGSIGAGMSRSAVPFLSSTNLKNYEASLGGTILKDRLWFFGTAQSNNSFNFNPAQMQTAKMNLNLNDTQSFTGSASRVTTTLPAMKLPSSFMTMHYTGIISNNMFVTASVSRSERTFLALPSQ